MSTADFTQHDHSACRETALATAERRCAEQGLQLLLAVLLKGAVCMRVNGELDLHLRRAGAKPESPPPPPEHQIEAARPMEVASPPSDRSGERILLTVPIDAIEPSG